MTKKTKSFMTGLVCSFIVFFIFPLILTYDPMKGLTKGNLVESLISPNKENTMNFYFIYGGSLSVDYVRVDFVNNQTSKKRNIYFCSNKKNVSMKWIDDETVEIDEIKLNIDKDYYKAVGGEVFTSIKPSKNQKN